MKSILDPTFHYVPSVETDLRKTFSRIRRDMEKARSQNHTNRPAASTRVVLISRPKEFASQR